MAETLRPPRDLGRPREWPAGSIAVPSPRVRAAGWDVLLVCVAAHIANYVGRVPQLFPVLFPLKLALMSTVLSIGLYLLHQSGQRRAGLLRSRTTTWLLGLLLWSALSVPGALYPGQAFHAWNDFARVVAMSLVVAGSTRSVRDVERLILV